MFLVRSGAINEFEGLVRDLGANSIELMAKVGLSPSQFRDPNTYISYRKLAELLEVSAVACDEPLFGLLLASRQSSSVLGDLSVIMSQQPTVGDVLSNMDQYLYLHARGVHLNQQIKGDHMELNLVFDISTPQGLNMLIQMSIGQLVNFIAELLEVDKYSLPLFLHQSAPLNYQRSTSDYFYKRIVFNKNDNATQIPLSWLNKKTHSDNAVVQEHFQRHLQKLAQRYPDNVQDQVKEIIGWMLPSGECSVERVARTLDLHPRVLQKRLKKLDTSYVTLLKEARLVIAEQHLRHRSMSVTDLALNLGYAEVSVFSRNFKQWTGLSPRQWQQEVKGE